MDTPEPSAATLARRLLRSTESGVLSTMSVELPGYPFGSVVPFVVLPTGQLAILVSDIAQHTANMRADTRICLTVSESGQGTAQELGRASLLADAAPVPEQHIAVVQERYYTFFPAARNYGQAHAFAYWWLVPARVRYIGGFGRIHWVEAADWSPPAPEWAGDEAAIIAHMNDDHADAVTAMARHFGGLESEAAEMIAVDAEGCHIRGGDAVRYLPFPAPALTGPAIREVMVAMTKASRGEH